MAKDPYRYFRLEARELLDKLSRAIVAIDGEDANVEDVSKVLRAAHTFKGAARVVGLDVIAESCHEIETCLQEHREDLSHLTQDDVTTLLGLVDSITAGVQALEAPAPAADPEVPTERQAADQQAPVVDVGDLQVTVEDMDRLLEGTSELRRHLHVLREDMNRHDRSTDSRSALALIEELQRVGPDLAQRSGLLARLSETLVNIHGESNQERDRSRATLDLVERELELVRQSATEMRLVPLSDLLVFLERTVRDAAAATGKKVKFESSGGRIRVDAGILKGLRDALSHVVRNAVAHGIEPPESRARSGKKAVGRVAVDFKQRGRQVVVSCHDDGGGVDAAAVGRVAVRRGELSPAEADALSSEDACRLILQSGVTTATTVTEIAGRGVGLDAVRSSILELKGDLLLESLAGKGTAVTITVPITLAALSALLVQSAGATCCIPLDSVRRTLTIPTSEVTESDDVRGVVIDNRFVPLVILAAALDLAAEKEPADSILVVDVVTGEGELAVAVDRLVGVSNIVVTQLPALALPAPPGVAGVSFDAASEPSLVIEPRTLGGARRRAFVSRSTAARLPVLVVDDSLTSRMLESSVLESAGFEVDTAESAEEALEKANLKAYGLFVVDVEMPGMNGFEFVALTRKDPRLSKIPAILVTSLGTREHKARGMEAGASAYIVKGEFDEKILIENANRLLGVSQ